MALRLRLALGTLLRTDASELARAVTAALAPRRVHLSGDHRTSIRDDDWLAARPVAAELGAPLDQFWDHVASHGLLVPSSWLSRGRWPSLWARAGSAAAAQPAPLRA